MTRSEKLIFLAVRYGHEEVIERTDFILGVILLLGWRGGLIQWYWSVIVFALTFLQFLYGLFIGYEMKRLMKEMFGTLNELEINNEIEKGPEN